MYARLYSPDARSKNYTKTFSIGDKYFILFKKVFENRSVFKAVGEKIEEIPMIHQSRALKGIDLPAVRFPRDVLSRTTHPKGTFTLPKHSLFFE